MADGDPRWIELLHGVEVEGDATLLPPAELAESVTWLGLEPPDAALVLRTLPDRTAEPERWRALARMHAVLVAGMPAGDPAVPIPRLDDLGRPGALFPLHALLSVVPDVVQFHQDRGVSAAVTKATLDISASITRGDRGIPLVDTSGWFLWRFRGLLYQVGPLRVIPVRLGEAPDSESYYTTSPEHPRAPGHRRGDPALSIHIPAGARFTVEEVRRAIAAMAPAFASWFAPDPAPRIGTCGSWLLDPQLREHLPATSNIVRFQDLFTLFDDGRESDSIMGFVFPNLHDVPLDQLPTDTTLRRAVVTHLRNGRRWRLHGGWTALDR